MMNFDRIREIASNERFIDDLFMNGFRILWYLTILAVGLAVGFVFVMMWPLSLFVLSFVFTILFIAALLTIYERY